MTLLTAKGTFTKDSSGTAAATQDITLSFTPKAVWLWTTGQTASGSYDENTHLSYGFSDGTTNAVIVDETKDNVTTSEIGSVIYDTDAVALLDVTTIGTLLARGSVTFATNKFTVTWNVNNTTAAIVHYVAVGGTDITNVKVLNTTVGTIATGNRAYTGVGFQGDFIQALGPLRRVAVNTINTTSDFLGTTIGVATSSTARWVIQGNTSDADPTSITNNFKSPSNFMCCVNGATRAMDALADFVSFDTDGFTVNYSDAPSATGNAFAVIVIKGGLWDTGNGTAPATATSQTINVTSGRTPKGVFLFTWGDTTTDSAAAPETHNRVAIGAADSALNMGCTSHHDTDAAANMISTRINLTNELIRAHTANATASSSTTLAAATATSMNSGNFVVNWSTTLSGMGYFWFTVSEIAGTSYTRSPTAEDVTVSDASTTRLLSALRLPSTDSITVADSSLTRQTQAFRTVSTDTTTVTDSSLVRSATRIRATAADSTTVADSSLTRTLSAVRVPTTEVPALSENLTRRLSATRVPSSDSVTAVDSSTTRSATRIRAPTTDTVTPSDSSLTRVLSAVRVPSSDSTTVLDSSLTRVLSLLRIPSADSITTSENVTGQYTQGTAVIERAPTAENVTVADSSITRLLSALRLPGSDSITTGEMLTRILSAIRSPTLETVVTADNATRIRSLSRATGADSISVLDSSLTRRLSALRLPSQDTITVTAGTATRMLSAIRLPSVEVISVGESLGAQVSGRISRSVSDTVIIAENLTRLLQAFRTVPTDTTNVNEQLTRSRTAVRLTTADTVAVVSEAALTRVVSLTRSVTSDTTAIIESALTRALRAFRGLEDTIPVSELVGIVGFTRTLEDTITVTEPTLNRIVTAIRVVAPEFVDVTESVFFQTFHKFVFDSVTVAESLFKIRTSLSGSVTYAIPDEVRPLLGNIGPTQRTDEQIELAIDAAYDEINTKTNRIPPNDWKDTDHNFGVIKKLARYIAAKEMAVGIKDFDTAALQTEIDRLWEILTYDTTSSATQNIVISSQPETYATTAAGIIWSTRYPRLKKNPGSGEEGSINIPVD